MFPSINDADAAISFALTHLDAFEVADFLTDWKAGADLTPWFRAIEFDRNAGRGVWPEVSPTA
jgi:hypothetical protein